jgi:Gpi18-like mannosyltransferase
MVEAEAGAAGLKGEDVSAIDSTIEFALRLPLRVPSIGVVLAFGLMLRLGLAFLSPFQIDTGTFQAWSKQLASDHPWNFYNTDFFTDYAPGYMYVLWFIGTLDQLFHFSLGTFEYILKLPSIAADLASAYVLYLLLKDQKREVRIGAAALYLLFPPVLLIGPIWGQVDSLLSCFLLLTIYFIGTERPVAGALAYTIGFLIKPQIIAALPFLGFWIMKRFRAETPIQPTTQLLTGVSVMALGIAGLALVNQDPRAGYRIVFGGVTAVGGIEALRGLVRLMLERWRLSMPSNLPVRDFLLSFPIWYRAIGISLALALVLIVPFFTYKPWEIIGQLYDANQVYRVNSFFAYNFWNVGGLAEGFKADVSGIKPNEGTFLGINDQMWGLVLYGISTAVIIWFMRKSEGKGALALGTALTVLAFYVFMTRMHERYAFAFFLPFLAAAVALRSRAVFAAFLGLGAIHFFNLYHVYVYYQCDPNHQCEIKWNGFYKWFERTNNLGTGLDTVQLLSLLLVAALPLLLAAAYLITNRPRRVEVT